MQPHFKEKLGHHLAYERKDETSKVTEYWVPARFSKVQLELYCSTLLSNSFALRSSSKIDQVGVLRDMLISLRKCCDHPYLVYQDLQAVLTKERPISEILNIGVYASGKLLLLDKLLHEMRVRGLRVLIVFQAGGGSVRNQVGDYLDDFLRQRFGAEAFEHVERGLLMSKKQIAMNNFNDKSKGRFVFLIENRVCQPSLKLSAVDAVLIYDSDWNPMNDTRNLQRINVQPERVPVFRLYSPCAVEEKVLSLAKQDVFLDSTLQGVVPTVSHSLLSWGAERLFSQLHQLHLQPDDALDNYRSSYVSPEDMTFVDAVMTEIMDRVCGKSSGAKAASLLVEAQPSGKSYSQDSGPLIGEQEGVASLHGDPPVFWSALLEGKSPQWRFIQSDVPLQRNRRKVRPFDNSEKPLVAGPSGGGETEEPRKKKKKNGGDTSMGGIGIIMSPREKTGMNASTRNSSAAVSTWDDLSGISAGPSQEIQIPSIRFYSKLFNVPQQEVITLPETPYSEEEIIETPAPMPIQSQTTNEAEVEQENAKGKLLKAQLDLIEKVSARRVEALLTKQKKEVTEMEQFKEREAMQLMKEHQSQLERLSVSGMEEKVRKVKEVFERKMCAFEAHMGTESKRLQMLHTASRELERSIKEGWVQKAKLGHLEDDFDNVPLSDCGEFIVQEFNWYPPTPPLVQKENLSERDGNGDIAPGLSNHTPSPSLEETGVASGEVTPVATALQGDTAAELTAQHRDVETSSVESQRNTMMEQNKLARIKQQENILLRRDEAMRMQLKIEMEEEIERLRRKYEEMLQEDENTFERQKQHLEDVHKKVLLNQSVAKEFRAQFIEYRGPTASPSSSASSHLRSHVTGPRPQLSLQHRGPQQFQRAPAPAAAAPWQGSVSTNGSLCHLTNSSRPPSVTAVHIPFTSSPLQPSATSPSPSRAPFSAVTLPPRPGPPLCTELRAPAPHLARARPHMSATVPTSTPTRAPGSVAFTPMQQLESLLARSQEGPPAQTETHNLPVESLLAPQSQEVPVALSQTQTQNLPVESMLESFGNGSSSRSGQVAVGDGVVYLSDDD